MKKLFAAILLTLLNFYVFAGAATHLYVQHAQSATISKESNATLLTLNNVSGDTIWFTDRPIASGGIINYNAFIEMWLKDRIFAERPPIGTLSYTDAKTQQLISAPFELVHLFNGHPGPENHIQFIATPKSSKAKAIIAYAQIHPLHDVTLFIDASPSENQPRRHTS